MTSGLHAVIRIVLPRTGNSDYQFRWVISKAACPINTDTNFYGAGERKLKDGNRCRLNFQHA
jgi:hypothetical protein